MTHMATSSSGWFKSSYSFANGNCVEVNQETSPGETLVRNSRHPAGPILKFAAREWAEFLAGARNGEFGLRKSPAGEAAQALSSFVMDQDSTGWFKSSLSEAGNCVEARHNADGGTSVRNSREPGGAVLTFTAGEWSAFLGGVNNGEFDR